MHLKMLKSKEAVNVIRGKAKPAEEAPVAETTVEEKPAEVAAN